MFDKIQTRFQYFIIFVDDYSRVTWLYLIKSLIALCKGKHTCISHPVSRFVSYSYLSPFMIFFFSGLIFCSEVCIRSPIYPKFEECHKEDMLALEQNET